MAPASRTARDTRGARGEPARPGPITRARASLRALEVLDRLTARGGCPVGQ